MGAGFMGSTVGGGGGGGGDGGCQPREEPGSREEVEMALGDGDRRG